MRKQFVKILFANKICGYFGGIEQVIVNTAGGLRARGHQCYLAYAQEERNVDEFTEPIEGHHVCCDMGVQTPPERSSTFDVILDRVKPDAVFFHKLAKLPPMTEKLRRARTVRMVHDHDLYCPTGYKYFRKSGLVCHHKADWRCYGDLAFLEKNPDSPLRISMVSIQKKIKEMRRSHELDAILPVSSFIRDSLVENGFPEDRVHVHNPILLMDDVVPEPVPEEPHILFVGQLIRGKGVDLLLQALTRLTCEFRATIVGIGNAEEKLKSLCTLLGLDDKVTFIDWVDHKDIGTYYASAKLVAAPSRWPEPFTLVGQESMRHGRPVIAFNVGGNKDWLEHDRTGILVPEQNLEEYANALQRVLTDTSLARQLGADALKSVRERFSFDDYLDRLEAHLSGTPQK
jgi:glycosyltransferase involved in cell wall biosynthesis